jgi:signal transduction histidine kinase/CheY-like chemotaxis protein
MKFVTYVRDAVTPGGTPSRYLVWVQIVLIAQVLSSVLPSSTFHEDGFNTSKIFSLSVIALALLSNLARTDQQKILAAFALYVVGLVVSTFTISLGITSLSGIVFLLTWAMTLFVAERREYISFDLVTVYMVLMLISALILLTFNPKSGVSENWIVLYTGGFLTAVDIYLVYIDFGSSRNFYQESRKTFSNLDILSSKLSEILSREGDLDALLWQVTEECVPFLDLEECIIYLYDEESGVLKQVAAFGAKADSNHAIINPIYIRPGQGIVGSAFAQENFVLVNETNRRNDYVVDDARRASELAVPIQSRGKVIGVIDSEHSRAGFFKERHVQAFRVMAAFCGIKITEHQAQESIRQAERAQTEANRYIELDQLKNRFITNISHDLKTPLSLIKAPAMQIQRLATDARILKHSDYILKNTEHLLQVVGQLLQLNRVDKGLNELYLEVIDVHALITKIAGQYSGLAERDQIQFSYESAHLSLQSDVFRLEQIIHNLVHNAFRYVGSKGKISLRAYVLHKDFIIEVRDNGPGISKEAQKKVFDRFYKEDVNNHQGTGIGLSLVKEYTHSLGGEVEMMSAPGKGTLFTVRIPFEDIEQKVEKRDSLVHIDAGKPVMLVVEDHTDLNSFICSVFEDDYQCISAFEGKEAMRLMDTQIPDILISDLMMPGMSGEEFIRTLRKESRYAQVPIVVLSAKSQMESRIDLYELGVDNYLVKPFDVNELKAVVENVVQRRKNFSA